MKQLQIAPSYVVDKQDHQALLKARYCPRVSRTQKNIKNTYDLDLWRMTLKFSRVVDIVKVHERAKFNLINLSAAVNELSTVH